VEVSKPDKPCENCGEYDWQKFQGLWGINGLIVEDDGTFTPKGGTSIIMFRCKNCMNVRLFSTSKIAEPDFLTK